MLLCLHFLFAFCSVWSAAVDALTSFVRCFISPNATNNGILLQPVMVYLSRYSYYQSFFTLHPAYSFLLDFDLLNFMKCYDSY